MRVFKPVLLLVAFALPATGCSAQGGYLLKQGRYLLRYAFSARTAARVTADPKTSQAVKDFLGRVADIKAYAVEQVGLKNNANFTRYQDIGRDYLADVVQACGALSFSPYYWKYPFLGPLPYKGFYERPDADAEADRLKKEGYDVIIRRVDDFSTLGILKDPLYSFMVSYSPSEIANLIIHEQTHATLFLKGQSAFNEELASFVGGEGALHWTTERYGANSEEYQAAVDAAADYTAFVAVLAALKAELSAVYSSSAPREEKLSEKERVIAAFKNGWTESAVSRFKTDAFRTARDLPINNAYLSLYDLYSGDVPLLRRYFEEKCGSDLKRFMAAAKALAKKGGDVKERMRGELTR